MVNTERKAVSGNQSGDYNILNIVVNTEQGLYHNYLNNHYNILNIVVNTELEEFGYILVLIITY